MFVNLQCVIDFEMLTGQNHWKTKALFVFIVLRQLSTPLPILVQLKKIMNKATTPRQRHFTHKCENSMQTNTSNRWLPLRVQHPFKIHMQPLKHACRNTQTHTHNYTSHLYTPAASLIVLTCTSLIHFLFALFVSVRVCVKGRSLWAQQRATTRYPQLISPPVSLRCSAVPRMWVWLLNHDVRGEWMAVALSWRHFALDSLDTLDTHRGYGCWAVNCR